MEGTPSWKSPLKRQYFRMVVLSVVAPRFVLSATKVKDTVKASPAAAGSVETADAHTPFFARTSYRPAVVPSPSKAWT